MASFRCKFLLLICVTLFFSGVIPVHAADLRGRVSWVYDGDTLKVDGVGKVRLIGIDTPEKDVSSRDRAYTQKGISSQKLRIGAKRATDYLIHTAKGKMVDLTFDRERTDHYGRILAYVSLPDGRMLNRELLKKGLACVYRRFDFRHKEDFLKAESEARKSGEGLWAKD